MRSSNCFWALSAALLVIASCTDFQEEKAYVVFDVKTKELTVSKDGGLCSVVVQSDAKWDVTSMPEWISLESIGNSKSFEWVAMFYTQANYDYDREGSIRFRSVNELIDVPVTQQGAKGQYVPVESVSLSPTTLILTEGDTQPLSVTVKPASASDKTVTWSSSNDAIVTISTSGIITAHSVGSATIIVKTNDGAKTATCSVSVKAKTISVTGVSLNKSTLSLTLGDTYSLIATVTPSNATNQSVAWSSSNTSVVTVSSSGTVSAKAAGSATITVTTNDGSKKATCSVTVSPVYVTNVNLDKSSLTLAEGETYALTATVSPSNATDKSVTWSSNKTSVASVSSSGVVIAQSAGNATITVTTSDGAKTASCVVTVKPRVTGVSLDNTDITLSLGETRTLMATVSPADAIDKSVTWSSNNTSVATVSSSGVVTAKGIGSATITVRTNDGGKTATCSVTVRPIYVSGVSLNKYSLSLYENDSETLIATVSPSNASNKNVSWSSSNSTVANVSASGQVTARASGTADIMVTTEDGNKTATCTVTVLADPYGAVDLGLSVKWASFNFGASSESEVGGYYKWGDPTGNVEGYVFSNPEVDNISGTQYDVVRKTWGGTWRIPTASEVKELRDNCSKTWTTVNGVSGIRFTGKTGRSIFLPVSGYSYTSSQTAYSDVKTGITQSGWALLMAGTSYFDSSWDGRVTYLYMFSEDNFYSYLLQRVANNWSAPIRPVRQ